jgi:hypothetical protein
MMDTAPIEKERAMFEPNHAGAARQSTSPILLAGIALYVILSGATMWFLYSRLSALEARQNAAESALELKLKETHHELRTTASALGEEVGATQKKLSLTAAQLAQKQKQAEEQQQQLAQGQQQQAQQIGAVSTNVAAVQSEVGGVKQDVNKTQTDLAATQAKLERAIGDLGIQSGLIAHTRDDLEILKHQGDRNYYEFTIHKSKQPTPVSSVSLALKKADAKHGKFTLEVFADDHKIEKKDRNLAEPIQFYTGRDHYLYELVVFHIDKDTISGYISTPKSAPAPVQKD